MRIILFYILLIVGVGAEEISRYNIDLHIEQSGELYVVETIEYDFKSQRKHGIYRDIPFTIKRGIATRDIGLYEFAVKLDDKNVEWHTSQIRSSDAGDMVRIKIGSADKYIEGKHIFTISYRVKMGVLPAYKDETMDAIRWNIIGTGWKVSIYNITANIFLPNSLHQRYIDISSFTGVYGSTSSIATHRWIDTKHLRLDIDILLPYHGATVELAYPSDALAQNGLDNTEATNEDIFWNYWHWVALLGFLYYFYMIYKRHLGVADSRSIAVQYEAPKGLSILQSGLIWNKFANQEDFSLAVIELAQLGYIDIKQKTKSSSPTLHRTDKEIDSLTSDQDYLLNRVLFKSQKSFTLSSGSNSKSSLLQEGFESINTKLYKWSLADDYMIENPNKIRKSFLIKAILSLVVFFGFSVYSIIEQYGAGVIAILLFPMLFGSIGISLILTQRQKGTKLFGLIFALAGLMPLSMLREDGISISSLLSSSVGIFLILVVVVMIIYRYIGGFTRKGANTLTHLKGLKEFIKRVKQDEIQRQLEIDPLYLERLLPYAILFGESKHWLSFYDTLEIETPQWYMKDIENISDFATYIDSTYATPQSSSSGGYSGGGGSSGGGSGGGGGGSW